MRTLIRTLAFALLMTSAVIAATVLSNGLTQAQQASLRKLSFAVLPNPLPPGFHVTAVKTDLTNQTYEVDYLRSSDGATLKFAGNAGNVAPSSQATSKPHGFFAQVASTFGKVGNLSSSSSAQHETNTDPAAEAEKNGVVADSALIGPAHFAKNGNCLQGNADTSKGTVQNAGFTVTGCNLSTSDPLIRAYKSVSRP